MKRVWVTWMLGVITVVYGLSGAASTAWAQQPRPVRIGVDISTLTNPIYIAFKNAAEKAGRDLGIDVRVLDHDRRIDKQIDVIQGFIAAKMDALVLQPENIGVGPRILKMAQDANIPVVIIDRWPGAAPSGNYTSFIAADDFTAGYDVAMALVSAGCKRMVAIDGVRGSSVHEDRAKGRQKVLAEHPDVTLVADQWGANVRTAAADIMESYLSAYPGPGFDCAWHSNDDSALGSWKILSDRNLLGKVKVAGIDLLPEAIGHIKEVLPA